MDGENKARINGSCIKCGLCAELCPVQAISVKAGKFVVRDSCIACWACLEICPVGAVAESRGFPR